MARPRRAAWPSDSGRSYAVGIARGAGIIAIITIGSRAVGLVRTLTFSQTVGATCLGTAYVTANQVPNLIYELVLGGALSTVMIPLLARHAERSAADRADREQVSRITSALLTWCLLILVPLTVAIVVAAGPIAALLNPANPAADCVHADVVSATASMLRIFAPQALLFGLSVILFGLLQAYRRFAAYALAPLVNSLVVITSCIVFSVLARGARLGSVPALAQLVLSAGTTLGVAAMVLVALVPALRLGLRLRPALRLPAGIASRAGGLALVGIVEIVATEVAAVVGIALANGRGATGALVLVGYGGQVFSTLNAVLALSISISAFPVLAARDGPAFDRTCAGSTRAVVLVSCLGVALIAAVAVPAAHVLASQPSQVSELALGLVCLAPGLVGTAVIVNLSRAMLAVGRLKIAAVAVAGSILVGLIAQVILTETVPARLVVAALALGQTVGATVIAIPFVVVTRRVIGPASVQGVSRAALAGMVAAVGAGLVGFAVSLALPATGRLATAGAGALAAGCSLLAFGAIALRFGGGDLRVIVARLVQAAGLHSRGPAGGRPRGLGYLSGLIDVVRRRTGEQLWMQGRGRMVRMNFAEHREHEHAEGQRRTGLLTAGERQIAFAIGVIAGGAGGYAVFASSNQAGTVVLLLISLIFLLAGVEGTPLVWHLSRPGARVAGKRRLERRAQRTESRNPQLADHLGEDVAMGEPILVTGPAVTSPGADDVSSLYTAE
jgi:putative peptidoglycan lipid II flippase